MLKTIFVPIIFLFLFGFTTADNSVDVNDDNLLIAYNLESNNYPEEVIKCSSEGDFWLQWWYVAIPPGGYCVYECVGSYCCQVGPAPEELSELNE